MKFGAMLRNLGRPSSWREAVASARRQHGKGTSRYLAAEYGVSQRTAQRWMAETQTPTSARREALVRDADSAEVAAHRLRSARVVEVGRVRVMYRGSKGLQPAGYRTIGPLVPDQNAALRGKLAEAAEAIERGDRVTADRALSEGLLAGYGAQGLEIADYPEGMTFA